MDGEPGADAEYLKSWVGRTESSEDVISPWPVRALSASFDLPEPDLAEGADIPAGWHWLYFLEAKRASELGTDGHPQRGGFLPPVPLPRRMWAGGRIEFRRPLRIGEKARRESAILSVEPKSGRSGEMVFVVVRHTLYGSGEVTAIEEQDIVYREAAKPGEPQPAGKPASVQPRWRQQVAANTTLLFRFSALTFNGHRIHYDLPYATGVEHYSSLIVHGPMQALLLLGLCRHARRPVMRFGYRGVCPLFHPGTFTVNGVEAGADKLELWTANDKGGQCMTATAELGSA